MKRQIRLLRDNLVRLAAGALPLCFALIWLQALVRGTPNSRNVGYSLATGMFYYLVFVGPVLLGGAVHFLLLYGAAGRSLRLQRVLSVALSSVVLLIILILGQPLQPLREFFIPILASLAAFGFFARLPRSDHETPAGSGTQQ